MSAPPRTEPLPTRRPHELPVDDPDQHWLIDRLWANAAVGVLGGTPKSMKTWLGLEMAVAVATATPCLGRFPVNGGGTALAYLAEDALGSVRARLSALAAARGRALDDVNLHIITAPTLRLDHDPDLRALAATLRDLRPRFLLLDPLVRLHTRDENDAAAISKLLGQLRTLQRHYGTAIALVHHTRKCAGLKQHGQTLRGSSDLHAWGDSNLYLTHDAERVLLTAEHRAARPPDPLEVTLDGDPPRLTARPARADATNAHEEHVVERHRVDRSITRRHMPNLANGATSTRR